MNNLEIVGLFNSCRKDSYYRRDTYDPITILLYKMQFNLLKPSGNFTYRQV
jgi:hypothetical protein